MKATRNLTILLLAVDLVALALSFAIGQSLRVGDFNGSLTAWWEGEGQFRAASLAVATLVMLVVLGAMKQHYSQRKPFWDELYDVLAVMGLMLIADGAFMFLNKWQFSRLAFGTQWIALLLLLPGLRLALKAALLRAGLWQIPVSLVGSGLNARESWKALRSEGLMGYRLVEIVVPPGGETPAWAEVPVVAWESFEQDMAGRGANQLVIALEPDQQSVQERVSRRVMLVCQQVLIVPPTRGLPLLGMEPLHAFSHEVLLLRAQNNLQRPFSRLLKRSFDLVVGSLLVLILSPVFAYFILRVRRSGGPAFFVDRRVGRNGEAFPCYKFRSMVLNAQEVLDELLRTDPAAKAEYDRYCKLKNDPRITPVGQLLRSTSLDELPQLWNVLKGEMSLVGPRPMLLGEREKYGENVTYYLQVRPGMTGLWQVSGRSDTDFETRVALDAWYVRNWSLWNDIVILIKTVRVVLFREGAY